jgi:sulfur transfer protein SufE
MAITIEPNKYKIKAVHKSWQWFSEFHDLEERVSRIYRYGKKAQELGLSSLDPNEFVKGCIPNLDDVYKEKGFSLVN